MTYMDGVASLTVHNVEAGDSGKYRCEASNRMGRVETSCRLSVNGKLTAFFSFLLAGRLDFWAAHTHSDSTAGLYVV